MMRFFAETTDENSIILSQEESKHLIKVLRLKAGEQVEVFDGKGNLYQCVIADAHQKKVVLDIQSKKHKEEKYHMHLAVAPTKNISRMEWLMEKATEIGVDRIIPFVSDNSERKILKPERLQKILISAAKQSLKQTIPQLNALIPYRELIAMDFSGDKFIAHCMNVNEKPHLQNVCRSKTESLILIGPEGDFSEKEVGMAIEMGFKAISLGDSRLRTETAALAACHIINLKNV